MAKKRTKKRPPQPPLIKFGDTEIHTWFERDRAHVELRNKLNDQTIMEWWDEAVYETVEDGYLKTDDWHGSAYKYAVEMGIIRNK